MKKTKFILIITALFFIPALSSVSAKGLSTQLKGKILIQVEQKGEAWYVNPGNEKRYYLGKPDDAFTLMRSLGVGISNDNIDKIQIGNENLTGIDTDNDGLSNIMEDSFGTDKNNPDTDKDGFNDKTEILNGYNPNGPGKSSLDNNFAASLKGKILLQVERNGEAWYVNPIDNKRYFLGKPNDAFALMRRLGLGISNNNLNKIAKHVNSGEIKNNISVDVECLLLPEKLSSCTPYKCQFTHPFTGELTAREITGIVNEKCNYTEEIPNNGKMECNYTENERKSVAQYYKDTYTTKPSIKIKGSINLQTGEATVDGKPYTNPLREAMNNGTCTISGY